MPQEVSARAERPSFAERPAALQRGNPTMILKPTNEIRIRQALAQDPERSNLPDITTTEQWWGKRETLRATLLELMGTPSQTVVPEPRFTLLSEQTRADYRHLTIAYD